MINLFIDIDLLTLQIIQISLQYIRLFYYVHKTCVTVLILIYNKVRSLQTERL